MGKVKHFGPELSALFENVTGSGFIDTVHVLLICEIDLQQTL